MPNATTDAILDHARVALPGVADDVAKQALYDVCDDLAREALRIAAPVNIDADPSTWLPTEEWVPNYQALLAGVLAALYGQFGKPYFNGELAKANLDKYLAYRTLSRTTSAGATTNIDAAHERIISAIRAQISGCRDETIRFELFAAVTAVRTDAYQLAPLDSGLTDPSTWLTDGQYEESYNAILTGTLYRLYGQSNMPWFSEPAQQANLSQYAIELHKIRSIIAGRGDYTNTYYERVYSNVRAAIPNVTDEATRLAVYDAITHIRIEAYQLLAIDTGVDDPSQWLTADQYRESYQAILCGALYRLYGQTAMPWASEGGYSTNYARCQVEVQNIRSVQGAVLENFDTVPEKLSAAIRAEIPLVRSSAIALAMFGVVNKLRVDAYHLDPLPADVSANPANWINPALFEDSYVAILHGTLAALYGQKNTPWFSLEQQALHYATFLQELQVGVRVKASGEVEATNSIPERIVSSVRAQIRETRDEGIKLEMFAVVNKIRREVYRLDGLADGHTNYTQWLTAEQYQQSYLAILYGTLSRMYSQSNMPWYNQEQFAAHNILFGQELDLARNENTAEDSGGTEGILEEARVYLPGARDEVMKNELRRVLDEFLKVTQAWQEEVRFAARPDKRTYQLTPSKPSLIVRVIDVFNPETRIGAGKFSLLPIAELKLEYAPSAPASYRALCALSLLATGTCANCSSQASACSCADWGVPRWIIDRWNECLFNGLLWRMMMQPGKSYTNPEMGKFHGARWRALLADARGATNQKNVYDGQTWRFPAFA